MDDDPQGRTATLECGVVFSALLSAGLGVFTTDVWWVDHGWLPDAHPAAPGVSMSLLRVSGSVLSAQPWLPGSVLPSLAQAFPGALSQRSSCACRLCPLRLYLPRSGGLHKCR